MYACIRETGCGFSEGMCAPSDAPTYSRDPLPPMTETNRNPIAGLRPEVDQASRFRGRRFSSGWWFTSTRAVPEHRTQATHASECVEGSLKFVLTEF